MSKKQEEEDLTEEEETEEEDMRISLDMDEIIKVAVQELMQDEDFMKKLLPAPIIFQQEEEKPDEETEYLNKIGKTKRKRLDNLEKKIMKKERSEVPFKYSILESDLSDKNKRTILEKINVYKSLNPMSSEFHKMTKYMRVLGKVPFGNYCKLPVNKNSHPEKLSNFFHNLEEGLSECTYGQTEAKDSIMEVIAKWITNPKSSGNSIGLCGPPGIGKTSLIKNGLAKCLKMPFGFITLGGSTCSSYLQGHDFTYEGSKCGRISEILIENKTMNPIIFFDELDKVSETKSGDEIIGLLIHLTDNSQNNSFHDKYFSGIDIDLSKCLFIFSFNDESKINPILRDRIKIIRLKGFKEQEKILIGKNFSLPKICQNTGFSPSNLVIPEETYRRIVSDYCQEPGVRKLEKCLETIIMKLNLYHFTGDWKTLNREREIKMKKPYVITPDIMEELLCKTFDKSNENISQLLIYS